MQVSLNGLTPCRRFVPTCNTFKNPGDSDSQAGLSFAGNYLCGRRQVWLSYLSGKRDYADRLSDVSDSCLCCTKLEPA
ncbi:hypothetical protein BaRGS_00023816, partial [Batillaria attramentaria]